MITAGLFACSQILIDRFVHPKEKNCVALPATFMSAVSFTFILYSPIGLGIPYNVAVVLGFLMALAALGVSLYKTHG